MRWPLIVAVLITACTNDANHVGNPLLLPFNGISASLDNGAYSQRRGQVELTVKSNFPAILNDIRMGSGPTLTEAMNVAGIPITDRPARIIQLQSDMALYESTPGALVTALMVYSS
ncbi:MAG: hypothetical protein ACJAZ1_001645 [Yoonia sp.]|jgi:hypothetical protein